MTGAQNVRFEGVHYEYASVRQALNCLTLVELLLNLNMMVMQWLGASGSKGYIDTQSAYLCQQGEPPVNVRPIVYSCGTAECASMMLLIVYLLWNC